MKSLSVNSSKQIDFRKNALNTLKCIAAVQVAYLHASTHLNVQIPQIISNIINAFMGVPIFFILSGFLIWNSIGKCSDFKDYAEKRAKRLFPELWLGVVIEIIPVLLFLAGKIDWVMLCVFIFGQATLFQFYTPGFLREYGCGVPNGSLWTIGVTIQFYFVVWFIHKLKKIGKFRGGVPLLVAGILLKIAASVALPHLPEIVGKLYAQTILCHLWMFALGIFLAENKDRAIPFLKKNWWILIAISYVFSTLRLDIGIEEYGVLTYLFRISGFIGLCYNIPKLNIKRDISYGLFIYHMIVVNIMIELGFTGKIHHLIIALGISILLAWLSTYFGDIASKALSRNKKIKI